MGLNISYKISLKPPVYTRNNRPPQVCVDLLLFYASQNSEHMIMISIWLCNKNFSTYSVMMEEILSHSDS